MQTIGKIKKLGSLASDGKQLMMFSPHTWGCTDALVEEMRNEFVFPTHVGVYRCFDGLSFVASRFPHTRGGVPVRSIS